MANSTISELVTNLTNQKDALFKSLKNPYTTQRITDPDSGEPLEIGSKGAGGNFVFNTYKNKYGQAYFAILDSLADKGVDFTSKIVKQDEKLTFDSSVASKVLGNGAEDEMKTKLTASTETLTGCILPMILQDMGTIKTLIDNVTGGGSVPTTIDTYNYPTTIDANGSKTITVPDSAYANKVTFTVTVPIEQAKTVAPQVSDLSGNNYTVSVSNGYAGQGNVTVNLDNIATKLATL